jgi:hypothetical protein
MQETRETFDVQPLGTEYHGISGVSQTCLDALYRLLMSEYPIKKVRLVSNYSEVARHGLVLEWLDGSLVTIRPGFTSGYAGTGPRAFSEAIQLLAQFKVPACQYDVDDEMFRRLEIGALTNGDWEFLNGRPSAERLPSAQIVFGDDWIPLRDLTWEAAPLAMPGALIEPRLVGLASGFWGDPDGTLMKALRKLESTVRLRSGLELSGSKLFQAAFRGDSAQLEWPDVADGEVQGRVNLFVGAYSAYRNPQMHREDQKTVVSFLSEFLVVNELFRLEARALSVPTNTSLGIQ